MSESRFTEGTKKLTDFYVHRWSRFLRRHFENLPENKNQDLIFNVQKLSVIWRKKIVV